MRRWSLVLTALILTALTVLIAWHPDGWPRSHEDPAGTREGPASAVEGAAPDPRLQGRAAQGPAPTAAASARIGPSEGGPRGITIRGEVFRDGEPLEGARVRLGRMASSAGGTNREGVGPRTWFIPQPVAEFVDERLTDADGTFAFTVEASRGWALVVTREGFRPTVRSTNDLKWAPGQAEVSLRIELRRGQQVRLQVVDTAHRPIAEATVAVFSGWCDQPPSRAVQTDEGGWFEITAASGDMLVVSAEGYARRVEEDLLDRNDAPLVLTAPISLGGIVVDAEGRPIQGAVVWSESNTPRLALPPRVTDDAGRFRWDDLSQQARHVRLMAQTTGLPPADLYVTPGRTDVRIVVSRPGVLEGRVVVPEGADPGPVRLDVGGPINFRHRATLDGPRFRVTGVPPGRVTLVAETNRRIRAFGADRSVLALRGRVTVERSPGADLSGVEVGLEPVPISHVVLRIVDGGGNPLEGALVYVVLYGGADSGASNAEGLAWSAIAAPPGTLTTARIHARGGSSSVSVIPVRTVADPASKPVEIVLSLDPAAHPRAVRLILFSEREDGLPLPADAAANWQVSVRGQGEWGRRNPVVTGPGSGGGRWRGELIIAAGLDYEVRAWATGCAHRRFALLAPKPGETELVCRLKPESRIRGRLVSSAGRPASRYALHVLVRPPGEPPVGARLYWHDIGSDGTFTCGGLAAGPARISVARPDGTIVAETTADIPEGGTLELGELPLDDLPLLRGTVRNAAGRAVGGAWVALFKITPPLDYLQVHDAAAGLLDLFVVEPKAYAEGPTRADGRFELAAPLRPHSVMHVSREGYAPYVARLTQGLFAVPQAVRLQAPGTVVVEIQDPPAGVVPWSVTALVAGSGHALCTMGKDAHVGDAYRWAFRDLPIGPIRFQLVGTRPDGARWEAEVRGTVVSGRTSVVRFEGKE